MLDVSEDNMEVSQQEVCSGVFTVSCLLRLSVHLIMFFLTLDNHFDCFDEYESHAYNNDDARDSDAGIWTCQAEVTLMMMIMRMMHALFKTSQLGHLVVNSQILSKMWG